MLKRLAIIPARSGSKRLLGKNLLPLNGKPLIQYTVDAAINCFDKIIISSDSYDILDAVQPANNIEKSLRPIEYATDTSKVIDTVIHHFIQNENQDFEQIWLCLPTCPLRTKEDILGGQDLLRPTIDGVVSITTYEFPPDLGLLQNENGFLTGYLKKFPLAGGDSRSQDQKTVYRPNGGFYGMWCRTFKKYKNFFKGNVTGYHIPRERSVDIDTPLDYQIAQFLISQIVSHE